MSSKIDSIQVVGGNTTINYKVGEIFEDTEYTIGKISFSNVEDWTIYYVYDVNMVLLSKLTDCSVIVSYR